MFQKKKKVGLVSLLESKTMYNPSTHAAIRRKREEEKKGKHLASRSSVPNNLVLKVRNTRYATNEPQAGTSPVPVTNYTQLDT